jgi:hypothetical protein
LMLVGLPRRRRRPSCAASWLASAPAASRCTGRAAHAAETQQHATAANSRPWRVQEGEGMTDLLQLPDSWSAQAGHRRHLAGVSSPVRSFALQLSSRCCGSHPRAMQAARRWDVQAVRCSSSHGLKVVLAHKMRRYIQSIDKQ